MTKYILKRLIHGLLSIVVVVGIVMVLVYTALNRQLIFAADQNYTKLQNNAQTVYTYRKWQEYGYLDYVTYADYLTDQVHQGKMTPEEREEAIGFGRKPEDDSEVVRKAVYRRVREKGLYRAAAKRQGLPAEGGQRRRPAAVCPPGPAPYLPADLLLCQHPYSGQYPLCGRGY